MNNQKLKKCNKCGRELPMTRDYFHVDKRNITGFRNTCKECFRTVFSANKKFKKSDIDFDVSLYNNVEVLQKFKKLYLEDSLSFNKIRELTKLSVGNIHFLLDALGIRLNAKQIGELRRKNKEAKYDVMRPSKKKLKEYYEESNYSTVRVRKDFFPQVPHVIVSKWFKDYKIQRFFAVRYKSSEERMKKIIEHLKEGSI